MGLIPVEWRENDNGLGTLVSKKIICPDRLVGRPFEPPTVHVSKGIFWYIQKFGYSCFCVFGGVYNIYIIIL